MKKIISHILALLFFSITMAVPSFAEEGITMVEPLVLNDYQLISMTDEEIDLILAITALEAQGEGQEGEEYVIEVILNRVLSDNWPGTVTEVIYQKGQFSTVRYLDNPYNVPGELEAAAFDAVIERGPSLLPSTKYVYFDTKGRNGREKIKVGHHYFGAER